jgi:hypothetical protein
VCTVVELIENTSDLNLYPLIPSSYVNAERIGLEKNITPVWQMIQPRVERRDSCMMYILPTIWSRCGQFRFQIFYSSKLTLDFEGPNDIGKN